MFGTLKPKGCGLDDETRQAHRRLYCGLCQGLGEGYGQLSRALVSFDAVFLAVLVEGLSDEAAPASSCRCPMLPVVFRPTASPDSPAMQFASAMSLLLADQYLADKALDDSALAGWLRPLGQGTVSQARETLDALGVDLRALEGFEHRQKAAERLGATHPEDAAAPTAAALARIFGAAAALPGVDPATGPALSALGDAVGRIIYYVDALEDLEKDALSGSFNPCLDADGEIAPARVQQASQLLQAALDGAQAHIGALPWRRHRALVEDIVLRRQGAAAAAATEAAQRAADAVARRRALSPGRRLVWSVATALISLLLWMESSSVAFAGSLDLLRRIQENAGDTGEPAPPPPPPPSGGGGASSPCEDFFACLRCCFDGPSECRAGFSQCQRFCDSCGDFCAQCQNCDEPCRGCGQICKVCEVCQGCQDCGHACQNCGQACQNCN